MNQLPIETPLPTDLKEGDDMISADPRWVNLLNRKVEALLNMTGVHPVRVVRSDANFSISIET